MGRLAGSAFSIARVRDCSIVFGLDRPALEQHVLEGGARGSVRRDGIGPALIVGHKTMKIG